MMRLRTILGDDGDVGVWPRAARVRRCRSAGWRAPELIGALAQRAALGVHALACGVRVRDPLLGRACSASRIFARSASRDGRRCTAARTCSPVAGAHRDRIGRRDRDDVRLALGLGPDLSRDLVGAQPRKRGAVRSATMSSETSLTLVAASRAGSLFGARNVVPNSFWSKPGSRKSSPALAEYSFVAVNDQARRRRDDDQPAHQDEPPSAPERPQGPREIRGRSLLVSDQDWCVPARQRTG